MKDFNEIYEKLRQDSTLTDIEKIRKKCLKETIKKIFLTTIIAFILVCIFSLLECFWLTLFVIIISVSICSSNILTDYATYQEEYKNNIISSLVSYYDEHLYFSDTLKITKNKYKSAEFERFNRFYSNDLVYGKLDGIVPIEIGDIRVEDEHTDSEGNTSRMLVFRGLFSVTEIKKNLESTIKLRSDKGKLAKLFSAKDQITLDSQEFEKYFDVFSTNKIFAVRILTSDIMDYIIDFKKNNKINFEITLKHNHIYIRIHCDDMFEAKLSQNTFDYDTLYTYYKHLDFLCELNKKIYNSIKEKDL